MATPTKRVFTDAAHALNTSQAAAVLSPTYIPQALNSELQNIGRRVRQNVAEGYKTQRYLSLTAASPAGLTQDDSYISSTNSPHIFRTNVDNINDAIFSYANQSSSRGLPRFCDSGDAPTWGPLSNPAVSALKRGARGLDDGDEEAEAGDDLMDLQEITSAGERKIRGLPAPKRKNGLSRTTQSLPTGAFAFAGAGVAMEPVAAAGFGGGLTRQVAPTATTGDDVDFGDLFTNPEEF